MCFAIQGNYNHEGFNVINNELNYESIIMIEGGFVVIEFFSQ